jgi:hypothetical protein
MAPLTLGAGHHELVRSSRASAGVRTRLLPDAEYSNVEGAGEDLAGGDVLPLISRDIRYARSLFG